MATEYSGLEDLPGKILKYYVQQDLDEIEQRWMSIFCKDVKLKSTIEPLKWGVFARNVYPNVAGDAARKLYSEQVSASYVIYPDGPIKEQCVLFDTRPALEYWEEDFLVFPPNMAWTMATVYDSLGNGGPFFAKHPDYERLVKEASKQDESQDQKAKEIARAKRKGWI